MYRHFQLIIVKSVFAPIIIIVMDFYAISKNKTHG